MFSLTPKILITVFAVNESVVDKRRNLIRRRGVGIWDEEGR